MIEFFTNQWQRFYCLPAEHQAALILLSFLTSGISLAVFFKPLMRFADWLDAQLKKPLALEMTR